MSYHPHGLLLDMLSMHALSSDYGCGLEPQLLEMLQDRHGTPAGCVALVTAIRMDGPAQYPQRANQTDQSTHHVQR